MSKLETGISRMRMTPHRRELRVLFCTDTYPPQVNGVSVVTALSVSGLRQRGWRCAVVAPRYPDEAFDAFDALRVGNGVADDHVAIPSMRFPPYPDIRLAAPMYARVRAAIARFKPDLIHAETEFMIGRLGQILARRATLPLVTSYHTDFGRYTDAYGMPWLHASVTNYLARFHRRAQRTYTPSVPARQDLLNMGLADVEVWGRGVDVDLFHPSKRSTPLRTALGIDEKFVFIHVGRLAAEKNVSVVLEAFRQARRLLPEGAVHLLVAGTGPVEQDLRRSAPESVTFLGNLDRQRRLPELYASADAFVFASVTETLGLVVLEAMASGLPVIAVAAGGVVDHLRDGINGLSVQPGSLTTMADRLTEQMVRLYRESALRGALSIEARLTSEQRSWRVELDRLEESYREVYERWQTMREGTGDRKPASPLNAAVFRQSRSPATFNSRR
jgi:glycosyltransferase involved in cell wall biosynthesis